jgi:hypothetical protein
MRSGLCCQFKDKESLQFEKHSGGNDEIADNQSKYPADSKVNTPGC